MRRFRIKFTIGQMMGVIAAFAVALVALPASLVILGSILLLTSGGVIGVGAAVTGGRWSQVAAWSFAAYPVGFMISLYGTWLTAWGCLGHRPRPLLDDPNHINSL